MASYPRARCRERLLVAFSKQAGSSGGESRGGGVVGGRPLSRLLLALHARWSVSLSIGQHGAGMWGVLGVGLGG